MRKTALVVGAAGGIGFEVARQLLESGWTVIGTVLNAAEQDKLQITLPQLSRVLLLDLSQTDSVAPTLRALDLALDAVLVCAGTSPYGPLEYTPLAQLRATLEVNSLGGVAIYQGCMPALRARRGRIVFISSFLGRVAMPFLGAYAASKFALEAYADVMRREAAAFGVEVIIVEPGGVRTNMVQSQADSIDATRAALAEDVRRHYGALYDTFAIVFKSGMKTGCDATTVASAIVSALQAPEAPVRLVVGEDAQYICNVVAAAPAREADAIVSGFLESFTNAAR